MEIKCTLLPENRKGTVFFDDDKLIFGKNFTDHMFTMESNNGHWSNAQIKPFEPLNLSPAALVLHYGQEIFEGMKAFRQSNGNDVSFFRPEKNAERMYKSAERMAMDPFPVECFLQALHRLIAIDKRWVPSKHGSALYIRPTMIATEAMLGLRRAKEYLFYIILSPVGPYFRQGFKPIKIYIETEYIRAALGGIGEAKTGGNYAASLLAMKTAYEANCEQVMWLDAKEHKYVEEVGAMNQFFVINDVIYTAPLKGTILHGVTRESVLTLAKDNGYKIKEEAVSINTIIETLKNGSLTEAFGAGTAVSIAPVGELVYQGQKFIINNNKVGPITEKLYQLLTGIQYGTIDDPYGWNVPLKED